MSFSQDRCCKRKRLFHGAPLTSLAHRFQTQPVLRSPLGTQGKSENNNRKVKPPAMGQMYVGRRWFTLLDFSSTFPGKHCSKMGNNSRTCQRLHELAFRPRSPLHDSAFFNNSAALPGKLLANPCKLGPKVVNRPSILRAGLGNKKEKKKNNGRSGQLIRTFRSNLFITPQFHQSHPWIS